MIFVTHITPNILYIFYFFVIIFFTDTIPKIELAEQNQWYFRIKDELERKNEYGLVYL